MPIYTFWKWLLRSYSTCSKQHLALKKDNFSILYTFIIIIPYRYYWYQITSSLHGRSDSIINDYGCCTLEAYMEKVYSRYDHLSPIHRMAHDITRYHMGSIIISVMKNLYRKKYKLKNICCTFLKKFNIYCTTINKFYLLNNKQVILWYNWK